MGSIKLLAAVVALCGICACNSPSSLTFNGHITDASMNTVTVENSEGTFTFSTMDADKTEAYGLLLGAPVSVYYKGELENGVAATKVATDPLYAKAVGKWTMPDPLDPQKVMGVEVLVQGEAKSISMATMSYVMWELHSDADKILLKGISVGSGEPISFTQTGVITQNADGSHSMAIEGTKVVYTKAN